MLIGKSQPHVFNNAALEASPHEYQGLATGLFEDEGIRKSLIFVAGEDDDEITHKAQLLDLFKGQLKSAIEQKGIFRIPEALIGDLAIRSQFVDLLRELGADFGDEILLLMSEAKTNDVSEMGFAPINGLKLKENGLAVSCLRPVWMKLPRNMRYPAICFQNPQAKREKESLVIRKNIIATLRNKAGLPPLSENPARGEKQLKAEREQRNKRPKIPTADDLRKRQIIDALKEI